MLDTLFDARPYRTSHAMVVGRIGRDIVSGVFPEGSILPGDNELIARFNVSRTVLREAMKTLAAKRLVEPKAKVGTRVLERSAWNFFDGDILSWRMEAGVDAAFIRDVADIRMGLEPAAASLAAERASEAEILHLYDIAARMSDLEHTSRSVAEIDLEFHLAVVKASRNPFMGSAASLIEAALALSFTMSSPARTPTDIDEFARNHLRIVQGIAARDGARAASAMRHVIDVGAVRARGALPGTVPLPD